MAVLGMLLGHQDLLSGVHVWGVKRTVAVSSTVAQQHICSMESLLVVAIGCGGAVNRATVCSMR